MAERRLERRARTRLRPGKLLTPEGTFLADCAILDRSAEGLRIRLLDPAELPAELSILDEGEGVTHAAVAVWSRGAETGLRLAGEAEALEPRAFLAVAGPFYAVR